MGKICTSKVVNNCFGRDSSAVIYVLQHYVLLHGKSIVFALLLIIHACKLLVHDILWSCKEESMDRIEFLSLSLRKRFRRLSPGKASSHTAVLPNPKCQLSVCCVSAYPDATVQICSFFLQTPVTLKLGDGHPNERGCPPATEELSQCYFLVSTPSIGVFLYAQSKLQSPWGPNYEK